MGAAILQFLISAAIIVVAGTVLTRTADAIADLTKLGRLLVGSILLAGATSLPELMVDLSAVRMGFDDLAVGDLMGSSLFNLLILAALDLWHHSKGRMLSRASIAHALSGMVAIALAALAALAILLGPKSTFLVGGVGVGCWAILVAYALGVRLVYYDQRLSAAEATDPPHDVPMPAGGMKLGRAIAWFALAAFVIIITAPYLAEAAGRLAEMSGLGGTFVGTALVALCTSLPELVAMVTSVRMGAFDLAIGNIFGSNAFNMILLVPLDLAHPGSLLASISPTHALTCVCSILVTAVAVMGQLYQVERRIRFLEPDAMLVILLVLGSLALIFYLR